MPLLSGNVQVQNPDLNGSIGEESGATLSGSLRRKRYSIGGEVEIGGDRAPDYRGPYEVTPSPETQVLETQNTRMTQNVTVHPIPSNYGLIEWNGAFLKVS